jgi:hypothetical protein
MVCLPASQFGCGCSVTFGVKFILLLNLVLNLFLIAAILAFVVFGMQGMALFSYGEDMIILGFALGGLPIIAVAFNGVLYRNEALVRMYLYYMWIVIVALVGLMIKSLVLTGPCERLLQVGMASAWACGMARWINIGMIVVSVSILSYFQHVVYSHCEDLAELGGGPELADLVLNKGNYRKPMNHLYASVEVLAEAGGAGAIGFMGMDPDSQSGYAGGRSIFGTHHEMEYPPASHMNGVLAHNESSLTLRH